MPRIDIWGKAREGAEAGGGAGGLRITHAQIYVQMATIHVSRAVVHMPGARGGGGAGGTGGGGSGGGGAGFGAFGRGGPFAGAGILARGANAGLAAFGLSALSTLIVAALRDIINAPQLMGQMWRGALSAAAPYIDVKTAAYALGRAGGFSGQSTLRGLFPGGYQTPPWMQFLGLTPEAALQSVARLGVAPRSANEAIGAARTNAVYGLTSAFAGMAPGTVERLGAQGLAYGQTTMGDLQGYLQIFASAMDDAIARGMDRARILSSIQDTLDVIAKSAPAMGAGGTAAFFSRLSGLGTPAARTGALQGQIMTGLAGTMQSPFGSPNTAMMAVRLAGNFNNFRTESDVRHFLHLGAGVTPKGMPQAIWQDWVRRITSTSQSNPTMAAALAMQLGQGMPGAQQEVARSAGGLAGSLPPGLQPYAMSAFTGLPFSGAMGLLQAPLVPAPGVSGASSAGNINEALRIMGGGPALTAFDSTQDYAGILKRAGVPANLIPMFISSGQRNGVSPLMLAAIAQRESQFNPAAVGINRRVGGRGSISSRDYGIMQINQANLATFGLNTQTAFDPARNIEAGAEFLSRYGINRYNPNDKGYVGDISSRVASMLTSNIPSDILAAQARRAQAEITGGAAAMATFVPAVGAVNDALSGLVRAAQSVISALSSMVGTSGAASQGPLASPGSAQ